MSLGEPGLSCPIAMREDLVDLIPVVLVGRGKHVPTVGNRLDVNQHLTLIWQVHRITRPKYTAVEDCVNGFYRRFLPDTKNVLLSVILHETPLRASPSYPRSSMWLRKMRKARASDARLDPVFNHRLTPEG